MRILKLMLVTLAVVFASGCATSGADAGWTCSAQGLVNSYYTGSDTAMIHLQAYSSGGSYQVKKNAQGNEATGTTADGTSFKCVKLQ